MENKIEIFGSEEFGTVRTMIMNGEPWFVANDVFRVLGITNTKDALRTLDEDEESGVDIIDPHGRSQKTNCINESGLYSIVLRSRKPEAKSFRRWITHEVIPEIRKHGAYISDPLMQKMADNPGLLEKICETMIAEKNRADKLEAHIVQLQPKADYFDAFVNPCDCTNIRDTAKELGVSERQLCKFLQSEKFMFRCPAGNLMPYSKKSNEGLFMVRDYYNRGHFGTYTLITPEGKSLLRKLLFQPEM